MKIVYKAALSLFFILAVFAGHGQSINPALVKKLTGKRNGSRCLVNRSETMECIIFAKASA
jgi:hypothetical protein